MNDTQLLAYQKKLEKEKLKPKEEQKEITCNLFSEPNFEKPYVDYNFLDALFKAMIQNDYRALPTQCSQSIMKGVFQNWKSFLASLKDYKRIQTNMLECLGFQSIFVLLKKRFCIQTKIASLKQ